MKILVINGANLNFLGIRQKSVYGNKSYAELISMLENYSRKKGFEIECFQSNCEGAIIDRIQASYSDGTDAIIINAGAYTHYSYAIYDALLGVEHIRKVEVHISDISAREDFRKLSVIEPACERLIKGEGLNGYICAVDYLLSKKTI